MSSIARKISQVRAREHYFIVALSGSYGYYPECINIGISDAIAEGYNPSKIGDNITAPSDSDLLETYFLVSTVNDYYEVLSSGTILKDLGKTVSWVAADGHVMATWRLAQRMRNPSGEGVAAFNNDVMYVPTFVADLEVMDEYIGVARLG